MACGVSQQVRGTGPSGWVGVRRRRCGGFVRVRLLACLFFVLIWRTVSNLLTFSPTFARR